MNELNRWQTAWQSRYVTIYPYQLAFGLSLRWFEGRPHLRLYLGPMKIHV